MTAQEGRRSGFVSVLPFDHVLPSKPWLVRLFSGFIRPIYLPTPPFALDESSCGFRSRRMKDIIPVISSSGVT